DVWTHETDQGAEFGIVGQTFIAGTQKYTFNVYRELITWNGETRRSIGTSTKVRLDPAELRAELHASGLQVASELEQNDTITFVVNHA
ncbi:MAG TPA: hypothetical protein VJR89_42300, partial [Polyangiales bacterium]|nr:hypothetical protein [Polyangiales bacterium]